MVSLPLLDVDVDNLESDMKAGSKAAFDLHEYDGMKAFDDQSGEPLDPILVRKAWLVEMDYFMSMQVYEKVSISEAVAATGRKLIVVRWVDMNKAIKQTLSIGRDSWRRNFVGTITVRNGSLLPRRASA